MSVYQSILRVIRARLVEDGAPTNAAGNGAVAAIGVGPKGEPPGVPGKSKVLRRKPVVNVGS